MTQDQGPNENPSGQGPGSGGQGTPPGASSGLEPNIAGALSYVLTWLTGIIFLLIDKESRFVRFHAVQAIGFGIVWFALIVISAFIPTLIGTLLSIVVWIGGIVLWLFLMYKAYQNEMFQLPVIGEIAQKEADKLTK